ncbi:CotH kinase family protein [Treponema bryantii]|uniref:CotH kinase family protein n=1 Tax=Treponema bryantii TaxID=163 RepID=UPI0003B49E06|nr:CotH kinase family protein [Treponema bryantii]
MKKNHFFFVKAIILFSLVCLMVTSCQHSSDDEEEVILENAGLPLINSQSYELNVASKGEAVQLVCRAQPSQKDSFVSYQWYEGEPENGTLLENEVYSTYTTPTFTATGIKNYYCLVTEHLFDNGDGGKKTDYSIIPFSVACTGLPVLYISTGDVATSSITKDSYCTGNFRLVTEDYGITEYRFKKIKNGVVKEGIKGRGNSSWGMPKKGYNIKFDKKQSIFGLPESKKWCIIANYSDKTLLRNKFASVLGTEIFNEEWNPTYVSVEVVLNGEYIGNYTLSEKNSIGSGRIDIQDISDVEEKLAANKAGKVVDSNNDGVKDLSDGGFVLEIDPAGRITAEDIYVEGSISGKNFVLKDPDEVSQEIKNHVDNIIQTTENALYGDGFTDVDNGWREYIDESSVIDWYIINEFTKNNDAIFFSSVYLYYNPETSKLHMGPNWDFDISCGNIDYNNCDKTEGFWIKNAAWISRMFQDPLFVTNLKARWNEKKSDLYTTVNTKIQLLADENKASADYNFKKWQILGIYVWPNAAGYENRTTYQSEVQYLIDWCNERFSWLDSAINAL